MPQSKGDFAAGRGWQIFAERLEDLSDEAVRGPVRKTDLATGLADAQKFGGRFVLVGREHHAEGREHHIESVVGKRQRLGIGLLEFNGHAFGQSAGTAALQQGRHVVR